MDPLGAWSSSLGKAYRFYGGSYFLLVFIFLFGAMTEFFPFLQLP